MLYVAGYEPQIGEVKENVDIGARVPYVDVTQLRPLQVSCIGALVKSAWFTDIHISSTEACRLDLKQFATDFIGPAQCQK